MGMDRPRGVVNYLQELVDYDVIIVGGGPAGLSAALILGRCRRRVLVCDAGKPRNARSHGLHGYLTRDGIPPAELLRIGREEVGAYGVEIRDAEATGARAEGRGFSVILAGGVCVRARMLLLATGVVDDVPEIEGLPELYGRSVFHCPYCDGWEVRDRPLAVYGKGRQGAGLALSLERWSSDIALCTNGPPMLRREDAEKLARHRIPVRVEKIARLEGAGGLLERIVFKTGAALERQALFFSTGQAQRSPLAYRLGCTFNEKGTVKTARDQATRVPGVYVAGDACRDVQFAIVAAAEGAKAAVAINKALMDEEHLGQGVGRELNG